MYQKALRLAVFILLTTAALAGPGFTGIWEGKENGLRSIELRIRDKGGSITGTIGFYFQKRDTPEGKWQLGKKYTVPLLSPKVEGSVLTFETIHHKCDGCKELGPNNKYRLDVVSAKEAHLRIVRNQETGDTPSLTLVRRE
jgi:hypothetical protein